MGGDSMVRKEPKQKPWGNCLFGDLRCIGHLYVLIPASGTAATKAVSGGFYGLRVFDPPSSCCHWFKRDRMEGFRS